MNRITYTFLLISILIACSKPITYELNLFSAPQLELALFRSEGIPAPGQSRGNATRAMTQGRWNSLSGRSMATIRRAAASSSGSPLGTAKVASPPDHR